jgi:hypothetical protein
MHPTFQQFQAAVEEFAGNLIKDILFTAVLFQVTIEEEMEDIVSETNQEPDYLDGIEVIFVEMIGMPGV